MSKGNWFISRSLTKQALPQVKFHFSLHSSPVYGYILLRKKQKWPLSKFRLTSSDETAMSLSLQAHRPLSWVLWPHDSWLCPRPLLYFYTTALNNTNWSWASHNRNTEQLVSALSPGIPRGREGVRWLTTPARKVVSQMRCLCKTIWLLQFSFSAVFY